MVSRSTLNRLAALEARLKPPLGDDPPYIFVDLIDCSVRDPDSHAPLVEAERILTGCQLDAQTIERLPGESVDAMCTRVLRDHWRQSGRAIPVIVATYKQPAETVSAGRSKP